MGHRLVFVTGKGGVGKSTVAAALAIASARDGRRTLLAEVAGQGRIHRRFGTEAPPAVEVGLAADLWAISIDPELAMQEYLRIRLDTRRGRGHA